MTTNTQTNSVSFSSELPTAHITIGNDRLKVYHNNTIYMRDGVEFKFELYNPKQISVLAVISINGNQISRNGLIIKPGQRVYLDRYIDEAKRFKFETYMVDDSTSTKKAIQNNGLIKVEFYDEDVINFNAVITTTIYPTYPTYMSPTISNGSDFLYNESSTHAYTSGIYCKAIDNPVSSTSNHTLSKSKLETGRVEMGSKSNQKLTASSTNFQYIPFYQVEYQIKPESELPIEISDIKQYCPECRYRIRKSTWKYCPKCGGEL